MNSTAIRGVFRGTRHNLYNRLERYNEREVNAHNNGHTYRNGRNGTSLTRSLASRHEVGTADNRASFRFTDGSAGPFYLPGSSLTAKKRTHFSPLDLSHDSLRRLQLQTPRRPPSGTRAMWQTRRLFPPKAARDRHPEVRLARPLLYLKQISPRGRLSQILNSKRSPSLTTIVKLARALDVQVADFFRKS